MMDIVERVKKALKDNIEAALPDGVKIDYDYAAKAAVDASGVAELVEALDAFESYDAVLVDAEMYGSFSDCDEKEYMSRLRLSEELHYIAQTKARTALALYRGK